MIMTLPHSCVKFLKDGTIGVLCDNSLEVFPPQDGGGRRLLKGWAPRGPNHGIRAYGVFKLLPRSGGGGELRKLEELSVEERDAWLESLGRRAVEKAGGAYGPLVVAEIADRDNA